jgi:hypothetical protein
MRTCNKQLGRGIAKLAVALMLAGSAGTAAVAEKVRGTQTCETGKFAHKIGGKDHTCTSKCTTPVTDTTCTGGACSTTVSIETSWGGCTADATGPGRNTNFGTIPQGNILEVDGGFGGGGRPSPTGQVRPPAATPPKLQ